MIKNKNIKSTKHENDEKNGKTWNSLAFLTKLSSPCNLISIHVLDCRIKFDDMVQVTSGPRLTTVEVREPCVECWMLKELVLAN